MNSTSTGILVEPPPLLQFPYFLGLNPHLVLLGVLVFLLIGWLVYTRILFYHWHKFAIGAPITVAFFSVHVIVSGALFLLALVSII